MTEEEEIKRFIAFEGYDFDRDQEYTSKVASILNENQGDQEQLIKKAKLFYYTRCIDAFDIQQYEQWKQQSKDDKPVRFTFQELVDMIEKGIEIPGIKQIPNVLNEGTPSEAKMTARPKPWEMAREEDSVK
ncbi:hypothetical protein A0J61_02880 [Choanephora cucurbitarum]|uniref:Uncharacterized protein n=1 Tax=Choanephora cucurbitarum TaxID=101091 RepID=A0A1C7NIU7_9FUNG|nr:hypothetical protein A0J61_02880 [Choanephora cucurbitarum]